MATARIEDTGSARAAAPSPRSERDLAILRALARRIDPHDPGAHNNLGVVYYQKGLWPEAVEQLEQALEVDPRMQVAHRNLQIAYFHTGYFQELVSSLRQRLAANPADHEARRRLARAYLYGGDAGAAILEYRRLLQTGPVDVQLLLQLARAERQAGDIDAAMSRLRRAAVMEPDNAYVQLEIGDLQYSRGLTDEALEALETAVRNDPGMAQAYHLLAFVYGDIGDERAQEAAHKAAELNPSLTKAEANLSLDRYSSARYDELVGEKTPRTEIAEGALAHYNLGLAFRQRGLYGEAEREFNLALERGEEPLLVKQARAEMMLLQTQGAEAAAVYDELIREEPNSPKLWNERGVAAHQMGDLDTAEESYRRSLELDSSYALALNNLGVATHHLSKPEMAEKAFRSALRGGRAPGDVWRNLALMLSRHARIRDAVQAYRQSLDLEPRSAVAWSGLGAVLMQMGRPQEAKTALVRSVEIDPELAEARYHLAFALSALGDYPGALRETRKALELDPYMPVPRFRLLIDLQFEEARVLAPELDVAERIETGGGIATFDFESASLDNLFADLERQRPASAGDPLVEAREAMARGELERAVVEGQRAIGAGADRAEALALLGDIFLRQGLAGEALERFGAVITEAGDPDAAAARAPEARHLRSALLGRVRSLLQLDRVEEARAEAEKLIHVTPTDVNALRALAEAYRRSGAPDHAVQVLREARELAPTHVGVLTELGESCRAAGQRTPAEEALRRAVSLDESAVAAQTTLAHVLAETGRPDEAREHYLQALDLLPSYGEAALALADLEWDAGQVAASIHVLVDLLTADPYHLDALVRLGHVLEDSDQREEAIVAYSRVLRFQPTSEAARAGLSRMRATVNSKPATAGAG